ncbi:hypothetical protein OBBRIDRAFT_224049 [Obba rivulosa]|uniref:C2H2-type domain-containing protein n=1 Tax=Obba rivulosa TaxID=1052685 RepID=A0A8E2ATM7_9APHY|nr:hypothetical protein OBBRIDRAFT_224049 [Obba rivulosa]
MGLRVPTTVPHLPALLLLAQRPQVPPSRAISPLPARDPASPANMNWLDPLDFTPSHPWPLDSSLHVSRSPSPSPPQHSSDPLFAPNASLEQELCSNFSCCGLALRDLHDLLEHFEEAHVVILGADGRPVYPAFPSPSATVSPTSPGPFASPSPSAPRASLVLGYPHAGPPSPADALGPALQYAQAASTFRDITKLDLSAVAYPAFDASPASSSRASSPVPGDALCLPPALLTVASPAATPAAPRHAPDDPSSPMSPLSSVESERECAYAAGGAAERIKASGRRREGKARRTERQRTLGGRLRDREKAYKCPRLGCTKTYLNPNGLKYHLEKGTCTVVLDSPSSGSEY